MEAHPLVLRLGRQLLELCSCFSQHILHHQIWSAATGRGLKKWNTMCIQRKWSCCDGPNSWGFAKFSLHMFSLSRKHPSSTPSTASSLLSAQRPWVATDIGHQWGSPVDIPVQLGPGCLQRIPSSQTVQVMRFTAWYWRDMRIHCAKLSSVCQRFQCNSCSSLLSRYKGCSFCSLRALIHDDRWKTHLAKLRSLDSYDCCRIFKDRMMASCQTHAILQIEKSIRRNKDTLNRQLKTHERFNKGDATSCHLVES